MRKVRYIMLILAYVLCNPFLILSQDSTLENAYRSYRQEKSDSLRIEKHFRVINLLLSDTRKYVELARELELLKKELKVFPVSSADARLKILEANVEYIQGEYIRCIISFQQAIKELEHTGRREITSIGFVYEHLGLAYTMVNDWENAQINYQKAINAYEQLNDSASISHAYFNMSYIFADIEDWNNAILTLDKSVKFLTPASKGEITASVFASLSTFYGKEGKTVEAHRYLLAADSLISPESSDVANTFFYIAEGEYFSNNREFQHSIFSNQLALKYARYWGDSSFVVNILENMGVVYMKSKDYPRAIYFLKESLNISEKEKFLPQTVKSLKHMFQLLQEVRQYKDAVEVASQLIKRTDSLALVMNNNRRIIMDASFENERKEKRILALEGEREIQLLRLRQKSTLNNILMAGAIIALVISFLSYRNYRQNKKLQQQRIIELETEKKLLATEAVLKGEEQERTRLAKDLHDGLGGLLSGIKYSLNTMKGNLVMTTGNSQAYERSMDMLDSSIKEMRRVAHNMMPEALVKFGLDTALKDFCNDINQTGVLQVTYQSIGLENAAIDQTTSITIYRIIQELVHNIMKHAAAKTAIVQLSKTDGQIAVTVEDDGKGFDTVILNQSMGIGWSNIQSRVEFLKGTLDVQSAPGKGTSVHIELNSVI